jgi:hypothetical protein
MDFPCDDIPFRVTGAKFSFEFGQFKTTRVLMSHDLNFLLVMQVFNKKVLTLKSQCLLV